jgi:hypothetical protein
MLQESRKNGPFWLWPATRRCKAKAKHSQQQCKNWTVPGKQVCRYHGGLSTGPKTKQGIENIRQASLTTGEHTCEKRKTEMLNRVGAALLKQWAKPWIFVYIQRHFDAMNYTAFERARPKLAAFCRGRITIQELAVFLDGKGKKIHANEEESGNI